MQAPSGVLLIDKAQDMTSHDVVAIARRSLGIKKIGHCGTLDPMATGLLMLVVGKATKLQDKLMCEHKEYAGTLTLGVETSSQDAMGEVVAEYSVDGVTEQAVREAFDRFDGAFEQIPPMVSAIKKGRRPAVQAGSQGAGSCEGAAARGGVRPSNFPRGRSGSGLYRSMLQGFLRAFLCV